MLSKKARPAILLEGHCLSEYDHFKQTRHVVGRQRLFCPLPDRYNSGEESPYSLFQVGMVSVGLDMNFLLKQALRKWLGEELVVANLSLLRL